jgi:DNA-binding GntR family transcriptional regulator
VANLLLDAFFSAAAENRATNANVIANTLRRAIMRGLVPAGAALRQDELARQFNVSQTPVREALKQLCSNGLATAFPNKGVFVNQMTTDEAAEIIELRVLLECPALTWAIPNMTQAELSAARDVLSHLAVATQIDDMVELNSKFLSLLYLPSRKQRTLRIIDSNRISFERYFRLLWAENQPHKVSVHEHEQLLGYVATSDVDSAVDTLRMHIRHIGGLIVQKLSGHSSSVCDT